MEKKSKASQVRTFPPLYKTTATGKIQRWQITVRPNQDGSADITVSQGQVDGAQQLYRETITEGKNTGRANATTPLEQAVLEATAEWEKKQSRKHYGLDAQGTESAEKRALAPMLALPYPKQFKKVDWSHAFAQPKYDGFRCIARCDGTGKNKKVSLASREGKPFIPIGHIEEGLLSLMRDGDVVDGELYIHGKPLNTISSYAKRVQEGTELLQYHLYDSPSDDEFEKRYAALTRMFRGKSEFGPLHLVDTAKVGNEEELMRFQGECIELGYEGAMLRHGEAEYEAGKRSSSLLKVKTFVDAEFAIVGVKEGRGTHKGMAIFTCITGDGFEFEVTAPGTHDEKKAAWDDRGTYLGKMLTVKFQYMTKTESPVPFLPVAKGIKGD